MHSPSSLSSYSYISDYSEIQEPDRDLFEVDFQNPQWKTHLTNMVQSLIEHRYYQDHRLKITNVQFIYFEDQIPPPDNHDNYQWSKDTEYLEQLREFNKFQEITLRKVLALSDTDMILGKKIYKAVNLELQRLKEALPIYAKKSEILKTIKQNRALLVVGNTGTGKSTQIIQYLSEDEEFHKKIALGQPNRWSLEPIAYQIAHETGQKIGLLPEHAHRLESDSRLEIHTHRSIIQALIKDPNLSSYSCVILDEAHERFIQSDLALSLLKDALDKNPKLKLIITSATANQNVFDRLFEKGIPRIEIKGIKHEVSVEYIGSFAENKYKVNSLIYKLVEKEIEKLQDYPPQSECNHILIFVPKIKDIYELIDQLSGLCKGIFEILPFHGLLDQKNRQKIFKDKAQPKLIISTRIGETGITIKGLKVVIDVGRDILRKFDRGTHMTIEKVGSITQSAANQRAGRTGRTCDGICYRLYSKEDYEGLEKYEKSALKRFNFYQAILILKALNVRNLFEFDFLEDLDENDIKDMKTDIEFLQHIDGLDPNQNLTKLGKIMSKCELEPYQTRILYESIALDCAKEVIQTLALFSNDWRLFKKRHPDFRQKKRQFCNKDGDFLMLWKIYTEYLRHKKDNEFDLENSLEENAPNSPSFELADNLTISHREDNESDLENWLKENALNARSFELADNLVINLQHTLEKMSKIAPPVDFYSQNLNIEERILKCLFKGYWFNVCQGEGKKFQLLRVKKPIQIYSESSIGLVGARKETRFMICADITSNENGLTGRIFSRIDGEWLNELSEECRRKLNPGSVPEVFETETFKLGFFCSKPKSMPFRRQETADREENEKNINKILSTNRLELNQPVSTTAVRSNRTGIFQRNVNNLSQQNRSSANEKPSMGFFNSKRI